MPGAAGHPRDEVGVDGADGVAARLDQGPGVRLVLGQPGQLGAGEVGVEPQPGQLGDALLVALVAQALADGGRTPVLPDDRAPGRAERLAVPEQDRLALVGDADRPQLRRVVATSAPRGWPRASPARSPRARARPSPAAGSAGRTPGSPCAAIRPSSVTTSAVTPVVPASMARTLIRRGSSVVARAVARRISSTFSSIQVPCGVDAHLVVLGADPRAGGRGSRARGRGARSRPRARR